MFSHCRQVMEERRSPALQCGLPIGASMLTRACSTAAPTSACVTDFAIDQEFSRVSRV
jgi:hypothetical protein